MDADFWHQRWKANTLEFHQDKTNSLLVDCFDTLSLNRNSRVFVPFCGKTLDIHWLLSSGYRVAGAELSALAAEQLFDDLGVEPDITRIGDLKRYSASRIDIFVGDMFALTRQMLGAIDAVFDRAALVALPDSMRDHYAGHLSEMTDTAPQLLITFEYDQTLMDGPPFSVGPEEIHRLYQESYNIAPLRSQDVKGGLKGICPATENAWHLRALDNGS